MPIIQIQRLAKFAGADVVTYFQFFEVANAREYDDALHSVAMDMPEGEWTRTLGEGSPLAIESYRPLIVEDAIE